MPVCCENFFASAVSRWCPPPTESPTNVIVCPPYFDLIDAAFGTVGGAIDAAAELAFALLPVLLVAAAATLIETSRTRRASPATTTLHDVSQACPFSEIDGYDGDVGTCPAQLLKERDRGHCASLALRAESSRKTPVRRKSDLPDRGVRRRSESGLRSRALSRNPGGSLPEPRQKLILVHRGGHMRRGVIKAMLALGAIAAVGAGLALTGAGAAPPDGPQGPSITPLPHVTPARVPRQRARPAADRPDKAGAPEAARVGAQRPRARLAEDARCPAPWSRRLPSRPRVRPSPHRRRASPASIGELGRRLASRHERRRRPGALHPGRQHVDRHLPKTDGASVAAFTFDSLWSSAARHRVRQRQPGRSDGRRTTRSATAGSSPTSG